MAVPLLGSQSPRPAPAWGPASGLLPLQPRLSSSSQRAPEGSARSPRGGARNAGSRGPTLTFGIRLGQPRFLPPRGRPGRAPR